LKGSSPYSNNEDADVYGISESRNLQGCGSIYRNKSNNTIAGRRLP
jgi:hypothetical protein